MVVSGWLLGALRRLVRLVAAGKSLDRHGQPVTIRLSGPVEPYYQDVAGEGSGGEQAGPDDAA